MRFVFICRSAPFSVPLCLCDSLAMPDFNSLIDSLNSPPTRHAMLVHMPIVLAMVGAVLAVLAAILRKNKTLITLAICRQLVLIGVAYATVQSGEAAFDAIGRAMTPEVTDIADEHEEMAEKVWMFGTGVLLLLALSVSIKHVWGSVCAWLAALGAVATIAWVGGTANLGGELVYLYGVGTPNPVACFDLPGVRSDGRDHAAERAAFEAQAAASSQPAPPSPTEGGASDVSAGDPKVAFFREQVYPILSSRCFNCHNASRAAAGKSASLDQTSHATLLKGGRSGPAIVPGKPEESLLLKRLRGEIPDTDIMPPKGKLPDETIAIIEQWIRDGAVWAEPTS